MTGRVPELAELAEDLTRIEAAIERAARENRAEFAALSKRLEERYVTKEAHVGERRLVDQRFEGVDRHLMKVDDRFTWLSRTTVTALVLPLLVLIIAAVLLTSGAR